MAYQIRTSNDPVTPVAESLGSHASGTQPSRNVLIPQKRSATGRPKTKVTRACDICKARKSKCSGEQPCESCRRRGRECCYEAAYFRGKPPTPRQTSMLQPSTSPPQSPIDAVVAQHDDLPEAPSRASPSLEVAGQYTEPTSGLSFLSRAWQRITNNGSHQVLQGQTDNDEDIQLLQCAGDRPLPQRPISIKLPTGERCQHLFDLYFDVCIATYRILHRHTVDTWLASMLQNTAAQRPLHADVGRARAAVVLAMLAVASFHEGKANGTTGASIETTDASDEESDGLFIESIRLSDSETGYPQLESAQSRLVQVLYLLMSCRFNRAWYTFGYTLQIISAMGLHRKNHNMRSSQSIKPDYIKDQCKKRVFWVAYTLDKYLGVIFGRPRHFHDDDIDQDLPDAVDDANMTAKGATMDDSLDDCHISALIHHAKLAMIAEKISQEVYSIKPIPNNVRLAASHRLGAKLRQWKADLPPFLGAINPNSLIPSFRRQAIALRLSYCHALILAHRPLLLKKSSSRGGDLSTLAKDSVSECISAARTVLETVDSMAREGQLFHAFWWTHYVCFCALVVVYVFATVDCANQLSLTERRALLEKAERCLSHLAQATATNSPSRRYSIILQELRAEAKRKTARAVMEHNQNAQAPVGEDYGVAGSASQPGQMALQHMFDPLFGSPIEIATPGLQNFLEDWQTMDWLQLDSSAFAPMPGEESTYIPWLEDS